MKTIKIGDKVRSFDFPFNDDCRVLEGERACYTEGHVVDIHKNGVEGVQSCPLYEIKVTRKVFGGEERNPLPYDTCYPPVNGTKILFGGVSDGVVKI